MFVHRTVKKHESLWWGGDLFYILDENGKSMNYTQLRQGKRPYMLIDDTQGVCYRSVCYEHGKYLYYRSNIYDEKDYCVPCVWAQARRNPLCLPFLQNCYRFLYGVFRK